MQSKAEPIVPSEIGHSKKFRAVNFVTGFSTNGLRAWEINKGILLKDYVQEKERGSEL